MKKRLISITLALAVLFSVALTLGGCGDKDYPVEVANFKIDKEPESIAILAPSVADIVSYIGYDVKMVGRSDEVNQNWMSVVPSVGTAADPDTNAIKESGATIVFADTTLNADKKETLENNGITVITMSKATTQKQLETNYVSLGKILGGKVTGSNRGAEAYNELLDSMNKVKTTVTAAKASGTLYTVCYLYLSGNELRMMSSGTYGDMLLGYTGAVNAAVNISDNKVDADTLKIANPNFVFYSDDATLLAIKNDPTLSQLTAIAKNSVLMVSMDEMSRQGQSALDTLQKMVNFMYPELAVATTAAATMAPVASAAATTPASAAATNSTTATQAASVSVAADYKMDLTDLELKVEDDNAKVKAMQQRLFDLGYITDSENVTGYYGEVSSAAVKAFQKNSGIEETGTADNATLVAMFNSAAVKAK